MEIREDFRGFFKREKIKVGKERAVTGLMFTTDSSPSVAKVQIPLSPSCRGILLFII